MDKIEIARVLFGGDNHLSDSDYGAHNDYAEESLHYYKLVTDIMEERKVTHHIDTGDLTFGRFGSLDYRESVEEQMDRRSTLTNGNTWVVKGNHDSATYGKTEYEFYLGKGKFKGSENISIGCVNINMIDNKKWDKDIVIEEGKINMLVSHGYFLFEDSKMPNYGKAMMIDNMEKWFGLDYIIMGHIHQEHRLAGSIVKDGIGKQCLVHYLPCLTRPSYHPELTTNTGVVVLLHIYDDNSIEYETIDIELWPVEKSFNIAMKEKEKKHKEDTRVDISEVVKALDSHERAIGNPEDIIMAKPVDLKYKTKAIELLKAANIKK